MGRGAITRGNSDMHAAGGMRISRKWKLRYEKSLHTNGRWCATMK